MSPQKHTESLKFIKEFPASDLKYFELSTMSTDTGNRSFQKAKSFRKNVQTLHQLSHLGLLPESLVKIKEFFMVDKKRVVVYEYCAGRNLL